MRASEQPNPFEAPASTGDADLVDAEDGEWSGPPWEEPGNSIRSFARTVIAVLVRPSDTFRTMRPDRGFNPAGTFGIWAGSFGIAFFFTATSLYVDWVMPEKRGLAIEQIGVALAYWIVTLFAFWIMGTVLTLVSSAIGFSLLHLALRLVGGARRPMITTFRVFVYALATFTAWGVLPLVGLPIGAIHFAIVVAIGLKQLHGISISRAVAAEILAIVPPILLVIAVLVLSSG